MPRVSRQLGADTIGSNHSFILPESGAAIPIDGGSGHSCVILTPRHEMGSLVLDRRAVLAFTAAVDVDAVPLLRGGMYGNMRLAVVVRFGASVGTSRGEETTQVTSYRAGLPQLDGGLYLTDAGIETDLIFNKGIEIREFAAHTLLADRTGREALADYLRGFLTLARDTGVGFVLDSQTWKAHLHWADALQASETELARANQDAIEFIADIRAEFTDNAEPVVLNGLIGPRGDAYAPDVAVAIDESEAYHATQVGWLAETDVDMVTAMTFTQSDEAIGVVRAATAVGLPIVVSFTVETDGSLPTGESLGHAIETVDAATNGAAAYFMVNCAHPDHFSGVIGDAEWTHRIHGLRCNASRKSHAELDEAETLDAGDAQELAMQYGELADAMPWVNVFGGCCGSDLRHVTAIARTLSRRVRPNG